MVCGLQASILLMVSHMTVQSDAASLFTKNLLLVLSLNSEAPSKIMQQIFLVAFLPPLGVTSYYDWEISHAAGLVEFGITALFKLFTFCRHLFILEANWLSWVWLSGQISLSC